MQTSQHLYGAENPAPNLATLTPLGSMPQGPSNLSVEAAVIVRQLANAPGAIAPSHAAHLEPVRRAQVGGLWEVDVGDLN